jgi:hypothetical protein
MVLYVSILPFVIYTIELLLFDKLYSYLLFVK